MTSLDETPVKPIFLSFFVSVFVCIRVFKERHGLLIGQNISQNYGKLVSQLRDACSLVLIYKMFLNFCRQVCTPVQRKLCQPTEECQFVPKEVSQQQCEPRTERVCSNMEELVTRTECSPIQRQECTPITKKACEPTCNQVCIF